MTTKAERKPTHVAPHSQTSLDESTAAPVNVFLTGGTGFLGKRLLANLAARPNATVYALCRRASEAKLEKLLTTNPDLNGRIRIVHGDIADPKLGMDNDILEELGQDGLEVFHCAAAYDLAVNKDTAYRTNIDGTKNVLDFAVSLESVRRFHHISTIIVSGKRTGTIYEDELDKGQDFNNYYEFSKFHAEKAVIEGSDRIPVTVYRPGIIIGDSRDGSTDKFDGPYFGFSLLSRGLPMLVSKCGKIPLHLVPVDFVADAITNIAEHGDTVGKTFHICDPSPPLADDFSRKVKELLRARGPVLRVPTKAMRLIMRLPFFSTITKTPSQIIPYLYQDTTYDTGNAAEILQRSGLKCPPIDTYLEKIVQFYKLNDGRIPAD